MDNGLQTIKLSELPEAITLNESDYSLIVQNGTSKKIKGLLLKGNAGDNGKSIEIQKTDTHIQWRQEGGQWINLVALADLKGDKGEQGGGANVDLTDYATKVWVTQQLASYYTKAEIDLSLSNYASMDHVHNYNDLTNKPTIPSKTSDLTNDSGFLTSIPSEYVTAEEMNTALSNKANTSDIPSLNGYATETFVTNKIAEAQLSGGAVDLSGYATKEELNNKADKTVIPTKTSDLTNDSGFLTSIPSEYVTAEEMNTALSNKANVSHAHNYNDLTNKPTIPSKTSDLTNDSGFLTSIPSEYVTEAEMNTALSNKANTSHSHTEYASMDHVHNYNDLTNKPTIPSKTSDLTNDSGFLTSIPSEYVTEGEMNTALSNKANKSDIPTKVSALENDSSFVTLTEMTNAISIYQLIQDNTLNTTAKTIPDAINELKSIIDVLQDRVAALENQHGSYLKYDV